MFRNTLTANVVIYTVGLIDEIDDQAEPKRLQQLAEETGGEAFRPRDVRQVTRLLPLIANQIHSYTLGYADEH